MLRPGNAGSNTAADHSAVLDQTLAQIPEHHRYGSLAQRWRPTAATQVAELTDRLDPAVLAAFFQRFSRRS